MSSDIPSAIPIFTPSAATNTSNTLDTASFIKSIFTVKLATPTNAPNGDFSTYADIIGYMTASDDSTVVGATPGNPKLDPVMKDIFNSINDQWGALPQYFTKGKCRDTSLGGNDAINSYHQFCENDDIPEHPFLRTVTNQPLSGMGRVYSETYDDQQQILYLTFGVPKYNLLTNFYGNAITQNIAQLMNSGNTLGDVGQLIGNILSQQVMLPAVPLVFISNVMGLITSTGMSKYYDFTNTMPLYYRCVNSMIIHLTINMGLNKDSFIMGNSATTNTSGGNISNLSQQEQAKLSNQSTNGNDTSGLPNIFSKTFDIYQMMSKKYQYMTGNASNYTETSDSALRNNNGSAFVDTSQSGNFTKDFITSFFGSLYDASYFIGFRVEKGVDTSESFSNETGQSQIAQQVNAKAEEAREAKFTLSDGNVDGGFISSILGAIGNVVSGAVQAVAGASIENVLAGAGVIDFPDIWKSSSFSKSYSFNISLRSPYGDMYSILQNLYIPLSLLLAGGLPRSIGQSAYTAPFVCRAYCRGMFAVPLGMITSMHIKRGADQFGWSTQRLPTCIDVSFEIKDLSPAMCLAIGDGSTLEALSDMTKSLGTNSNFQEYLMTLSGMGLADRLMWFRNLRRKAQYLLGQVTSTKLSPFYWGASFGNSLPGRMMSVLAPTTKIPSN